MVTKGIILAGGRGTRLLPITKIINKQLLLVYDKPMIFYPLSTLMLMGIREILIVTNSNQKELFKNLLGDGSSLGISINYRIQNNPDGLAHAIQISESFINKEPVVVILGDNLFHGSSLIDHLSLVEQEGATIFAASVNDPERYGIVTLSDTKIPISIEEKPNNPNSKLAITGLYVFDDNVIEKTKAIRKSERAEMEITDLLNIYLEEKSLTVKRLSRGIAWFDTGTFDSLHDAGSYVKSLELRQGLKVCCPEEIAWRQNWINDKDLNDLAENNPNNDYGKYLSKLIYEKSDLF